MDYGHKEADKLLNRLEKKLSKEYSQATNGVKTKLLDYLKKFEDKDKAKIQQLKNNDITENEYLKWRTGQMAIGKRWEEMQDTLAEDFHNVNKIASSMIKEHAQDVYALNHNFGTFEVEHGAMVDTSYTLYDRSTVERLMKDNPDLLPPPGKRTSQRIREGKDVLWNKQQIQSVMTQSILQGYSIPKIAKILALAVSESNRKASIRNARTMTTGAENAGRIDSYKRAEAMGIKMKQMWMAALDGRTRHEHRLLDGQTIKVGEKFKVSGYELEYPGDPHAAPEMVYNCRCTLVAIVDGADGINPEDRNSKLGNMSYYEWKHEHEERG